MKNILKKIILVSTVVTAFTSCSNFLEQDPDTLLYPEQVYSTQEGVEAAVNGLYASMADYNYYGAAWHGLVNPHSGRMWSYQSVTTDATSLNCGTENRWLVVLWDQMYKTISVANNIIANMETSTLPNRDTALGQAYFIRGFVYFDMVRLWGGVPLRVKPTTQDDLYLPKSTKQQVYDQIFADFHKAEQLLPEKGVLAIDRPTKYTVEGYLAKAYMQLAGEDGGNPALWQNAWDEAIKLYGKYTLVNSYASLFDPTNVNFKENSSEAIFELQFGHYGTVRTSDMIRMYTPNNSIYCPKFDTYGWIRPNKETYDQQKTQYPTDPRLAISYITDSYPKATGGVQNVYPKTTTGRHGYVVIKKWFDASYDGTTTVRNLTLFRYADLLLMLAEIRNEIDGGPANAYQYVNPVLARARNSVSPAATSPADWSGMTKEQFRDRIMQERKFELLSEGQDWFDARRRGFQYFLDKTITPHNTHPKIAVGNLDYLYPTSEKNMLLPIPQTEISANPKMSSTDQNPGY